MASPRFVDRHAVGSSATPEGVWAALTRSMEAAFGGLAHGYARLVGCDPLDASGPRPLAVGSTMPGFRVVEADAPRTLTLVGRHRFSTYELRFTIEPDGTGSRLVAHTEATFPGALGAIYRAAVIRSGAHAVVTRRMIRRIAASA